MAPDLVRQRDNGCEVTDCPASWRKLRAVNHATDKRQQKEVHPLEVSHDTIKADAKAGLCQFFSCCRPFDANAEEVAENRFEKVEGETAEEKEEESEQRELTFKISSFRYSYGIHLTACNSALKKDS